jgi:multicomponent Na+:H+ antiporter subunit E
MKRLKSFIIIFFLLFFVWFLINSSLDLAVLITGGIVSFLVSLFACQKCEVLSEIKLHPLSPFYALLYVFIFLKELIFSNLDVARIVLTPSLPINPGIVEVKTKLKSNIGKLVLANSITLTPGTLTVDVKEDSLFIHWVNVKAEDTENATKKIVSGFEKYLEVIYG